VQERAAAGGRGQEADGSARVLEVEDRRGCDMSTVVEVSEQDFEKEVLQSDVPVVVDMWAEWCGPCHVLAPIVEEVSGALAGKVKFVKVNVDRNPNLAGRFGIMSIPTLLFFKGGKVVGQTVGAIPKETILGKVESDLGVTA
jgi:thioredoxin 1